MLLAQSPQKYTNFHWIVYGQEQEADEINALEAW